MMNIIAIRAAKVTYPTGSKSFAVMQSFPAAFTAEESDPFLMCDEFGPTLSHGAETNPDKFPVDWHPHRGQDLLSYLVEGVGRHADSLGNRGTFPHHGLQWISAGSGIEHAEAGGTPEGEYTHGFQIWVNVPSARKMDDPKYGTHDVDEVPVLTTADGVTVRVLAGHFEKDDFESTGPFQTVCDVQILDITLPPAASVTHTLPLRLDNCLIHVYGREGKDSGSTIQNKPVGPSSVVRLDANNSKGSGREIVLSAGSEGLRVMLFAGKMLNQPIAWHGPFVMTTDEEIRRTVNEYRQGKFLRKRAAWDYKKYSAAPPGYYDTTHGQDL